MSSTVSPLLIFLNLGKSLSLIPNNKLSTPGEVSLILSKFPVELKSHNPDVAPPILASKA